MLDVASVDALQFLVHSLTEGGCGSFQHLAIVNCAALNIGVQGSLGLVFQGPWGVVPTVGSLGQKAVPFLVF